MFYQLKVLLRSLRRNYIYSGINVAGLAIGITASALIFLWVYHERSFDTCYPDSNSGRKKASCIKIRLVGRSQTNH